MHTQANQTHKQPHSRRTGTRTYATMEKLQERPPIIFCASQRAGVTIHMFALINPAQEN